MNRIDSLIDQMTTAEKAGQLNQKLYGFDAYIKSSEGDISPSDDFIKEVDKYSGLGFLYGLFRADPWSKRDFKSGLCGAEAPKTYNMLQRYVLEHSRLSIPMLVCNECPHGSQMLDGYLVPVNTAVGAAFNPELLYETSRISGLQQKSIGVGIALMSMLDILRDPRWGRSEECYSEDPYLAARMAEAAVKGMQSTGVLCVAKHYAAQGETTGGVNASPASIGDNELREIHLPAAASAVNAGVAGIMAAYNEIDGIPCHANPYLLRTILRGEMGFEGIVMADGTAIDRLDAMTGNNRASARLALNAGVDAGLWDEAYGKLADIADEDPKIMHLLDESVRRVLAAKEKSGVFEHPYVDENDRYILFSKDAGYTSKSKEMARQSLILLANKNKTLPFDSSVKSVAVIGPAADDIYRQLGDYTPYVHEDECSTIYAGLKKGAPEIKVILLEETDYAQAVNFDMTVLALGGSSSRFGKAEFDINGAAVNAENADMDCGEGVDSASLELPYGQNKLLEKLAGLNVRLVTVIIAGRPYVVRTAAELSSALLYSFYPGPFGGEAIADVLLGKICPSGLLPASIPESVGQLPVYYNHRIAYDAMNYKDLNGTIRYSFGYGLSYTEFDYHVQKCESNEISIDVTNSGGMDAYDTLLLFAKRNNKSRMPREKELIDFKKVFLKTGAMTNIVFSIPEKDAEYVLCDGRGEVCTY